MFTRQKVETSDREYKARLCCGRPRFTYLTQVYVALKVLVTFKVIYTNQEVALSTPA